LNHARSDARNTEPAFLEVTANRTHRGAGKIDVIVPTRTPGAVAPPAK
jgi:hypothetical protein